MDMAKLVSTGEGTERRTREGGVPKAQMDLHGKI